MSKFILICYLLFTPLLQMEGQSLQVSGSSVQLPAGNVLGAAFYEDKGMFFVQQVLPSTQNRGFVRQLSSWNLESRTMIMKRVIDETPFGATIFTPGQLHISTTTHQVYICSAASYLEVIDPDTLETIGTMAQIDGQIIADFAVDDPNGIVFVLSVQRDGSIHLSSYNLLNGDKQKDVVLPATYKHAVAYESLNFSLSLSQSGQIGLYLGGDGRYLTHSGIYFCTEKSSLECDFSIVDNSISQFSFLGQKLLIADDGVLNGHGGCIQSLNPSSRYSLIRRYSELVVHPLRYCVPMKVSRSGVHHPVGVVEDRYVVGYTGVAKAALWSLEISPVSSSWSVWKADSTRVAAVVKEPLGYGMYQFGLRIATSTTKPLFMTYSHASNSLYMYSIADNIGGR